MTERTRRVLSHPGVGVAALWASLFVAFVVTGGGDRQDVAQLFRLGIMISSGVIWGHWSRSQRQGRPSDNTSVGTDIAIRLAVLGSAAAAALALVVVVLTPGSARDWGDAAAVWGAGFAGIAAFDLLGCCKRPAAAPPGAAATVVGSPLR